MLRGFRHGLAALALVTLAWSGAVSTTATRPAMAASAAWTLPTVPPKCSSTMVASGNVAGCVVMGGYGLPESQGWPTPPFPSPADPSTTTWTDLAKGTSGSLVQVVQQALVDAGYSLVPDGQFGPITEAQVKLFQGDHGLPVTGVVDAATAAALDVSATSGGTFPPPGWVWKGWTYNGSPALADWEAHLASNLAPIGTVKSGQLTMMPEALPLFEGFLNELVQTGYKIYDLSGYNYRCTASTSKSCAGLTRAALSNHAYGLAMDFNTGANPMATYYGINGATACATPIKTDLPQSAIQIAEKWGLYWGGYGWSSGCTSPSQQKYSASRDPMHFEFRGSVDQAKAILQYNLENNPSASTGPIDCLKIENDQGAVTRCLRAGEIPPAGSRLVVDTKAPAGSAAALVNLTLTGAKAPGFVTAESCDAVTSSQRAWSNANTSAGATVANLAVVPLDAAGRFCLYLSTAVHTIVDVQGFFATAANAPDGALFTPVAASRLVDTRSQSICSTEGDCGGAGPVPAGQSMSVTASGVPSSAVAELVNLTVTEPAAPGYLTANSCSALVPGPQTSSNVNFGKGATVANLAVVPVDASDSGARVCTYSIAPTQQVVDVQGYFAPAAQGGLGYDVAAPQRLVDTRGCWTDPQSAQQRCGAINPAGSVVRMQAPAGAAAVLVNLTLTEAKAAGWAAADRCSTVTASVPQSSNANVAVGGTAANLAVVPVDPDGTFCVYVSVPTHVVVDLQGAFSATGAMRLSPVAPVRRMDSRADGV